VSGWRQPIRQTFLGFLFLVREGASLTSEPNRNYLDYSRNGI
jgi:hypothetical protein